MQMRPDGDRRRPGCSDIHLEGRNFTRELLPVGATRRSYLHFKFY